MRFTTALVTATLAYLATASPDSPAVVSRYPSDNSPVKLLSVSPSEASLALAELAGVAQYYDLGVQSTADRKLELIDKLNSNDDVFSDSSAQFMVSLAATGGLASAAPVLSVSNPPHATEAASLIMSLARNRASVEHTTLHSLYNLGSSFCLSTVSLPLDVRVRTDLPNAHLFNEDDDSTASELTHFRQVAALAPKIAERGGSIFCHSGSLADLTYKYGADSPQIKVLLAEYDALISRTGLRAVVLQTGSTSSSSSYTLEELKKRSPQRSPEETPLNLHAKLPADTAPRADDEDSDSDSDSDSDEDEHEKVKQVAAPITPARISPLALSRCHRSEDDCKNATSSCSGHGACKKIRNCFTCVCEPTVVKNKEGQVVKRTGWAGAACEKKDIAVPFNLFLVFGVVIVLAVVWAVGMLWSVGEEALPGVLSAGVAPVKRD